MQPPQNIFSGLPIEPNSEDFLTLFDSGSVEIKRIVSHSHASPEDFWYDQDHDEWVIVLKGEAVLEFNDGQFVELKTGDHLLISKHTKHRVEKTSEEVIWLAVHVKN